MTIFGNLKVRDSLPLHTSARFIAIMRKKTFHNLFMRMEEHKGFSHRNKGLRPTNSTVII